MAEEMQIRNLAARTIDSYTWHVDKFRRYFGKSAQDLSPEEIRQYQLHLVHEKKASWSAFNRAVCGLRFLYEVTLGKPWAIQHIPFGKHPKKLPVVLSDQQASRLIECTHNLKHRMVLLCCYAAGLRLAEATHVKVADIDGPRAQIRITCRTPEVPLSSATIQKACRLSAPLAGIQNIVGRRCSTGVRWLDIALDGQRTFLVHESATTQAVIAGSSVLS